MRIYIRLLRTDAFGGGKCIRAALAAPAAPRLAASRARIDGSRCVCGAQTARCRPMHPSDGRRSNFALAAGRDAAR